MSDNGVRRACPADHKRELLDQQGFVCIYCAEPFGSIVRRRGKLILTVAHCDHAVPLAYLNANPRWNWVVACNLCNTVKGSKVFHSISEVRAYVLGVRDRRNDVMAWLAPVSSEQDPTRWAVSFATYLSNLGYFDSEQVQRSPALKTTRFKTALGTALSDMRSVLGHDANGTIAWSSTAKGPWPWSA